MEAYQARFSKTLCDIFENKIDELTNLLVSTRAVDFSGYTERVGHIKGLQWALQEARDLETRLDRPEGQKAAQNTVRQSYET